MERITGIISKLKKNNRKNGLPGKRQYAKSSSKHISPKRCENVLFLIQEHITRKDARKYMLGILFQNWE